MIETREYRGFWWLPEDDQRRLSGTLTVSEGDPRLELLDNFGHHLLSEGEGQKVYSHALEERPRILGVSVDGKHITLEQANVLSSSMHFPGIPTSTYAHGVALVGAHFLPDEEIVFDEISIEATDLNAWALISGFDINVGMEKHEERDHYLLTKIDVGFESPDEIEIPLARGERAFIRFTATSSGLGPLTAEVNLRQDAALHLHFAKRAALPQVFKRVGQLRNFLSLAVGRPVTILSATGYQDDFVHPQTGDRIPIELLWGIPHSGATSTQGRTGSATYSFSMARVSRTGFSRGLLIF